LKLRPKILLSTLVIVTTLTAGVFAVAREVLLAEFRILEEQDMQENLGRVESAIEGELGRISLTANDWGHWDDSYTFVQGLNEDLITTLIDDAVFKLELDAIVFLDRENKVYFAKAVSLITGEPRDIPEGLVAQLSGDSPLLQIPDLTSDARGIVLLEEGAALIAVRNILTTANHDVTTAENGKVAVQCTAIELFDVILMDVQMPEMDGYEATGEIRKLEEQTGRRRTPILGLTANASAEDAAACINAGMDAHLAKPVRRDGIRRAIENLLGQSLTNQADNKSEMSELLVLDITSLEDLKILEDTGDFSISEVVEIFLVDAPRRIATAREAIGTQSWADVQREAHTIKGGARDLGTRQLAEACDGLERHAARNPTTEVATQQLEIIEERLVGADKALREYLEGGRGSTQVG
jgi:sensor domain CHASE-containing protein/HPt (histidine-containing phosphotransfer) domain-containing protein